MGIEIQYRGEPGDRFCRGIDVSQRYCMSIAIYLLARYTFDTCSKHQTGERNSPASPRDMHPLPAVREGEIGVFAFRASHHGTDRAKLYLLDSLRLVYRATDDLLHHPRVRWRFYIREHGPLACGFLRTNMWRWRVSRLKPARGAYRMLPAWRSFDFCGNRSLRAPWRWLSNTRGESVIWNKECQN
jgi:hypothetical protein